MSARTRSMGDTRFDTGVGFLSLLVRLERNLRPFHFYTAEWTPPTHQTVGQLVSQMN